MLKIFKLEWAFEDGSHYIKIKHYKTQKISEENKYTIKCVKILFMKIECFG